LGICTFTCYKYQRTAFRIYYTIEISKIRAETEEPRQIEDDHREYDIDIYHDFKKLKYFLIFKKVLEMSAVFLNTEFCSLVPVPNRKTDHI
jgi:hypothetical protein